MDGRRYTHPTLEDRAGAGVLDLQPIDAAVAGQTSPSAVAGMVGSAGGYYVRLVVAIGFPALHDVAERTTQIRTPVDAGVERRRGAIGAPGRVMIHRAPGIEAGRTSRRPAVAFDHQHT